MTEEIAGFQTSPKAQVQAAFEEIARRSMHDLSFLHPSMPVYVSDFTLFEGQWTGCVITPALPDTPLRGHDDAAPFASADSFRAPTGWRHSPDVRHAQRIAGDPLNQ